MNNLKCRKQGFRGFICKRNNTSVTLSDCSNCPYKEYKYDPEEIKKRFCLNNENCKKTKNNVIFCKKTAKMPYILKKQGKINQKTKKLAKLEKNRFSIFTDDLEHCIFCGKRKDNLHEVIFGKNRLNSIKYGLVIPVCYEHHLECHKNSQLQEKWKIKAQEVFEKKYTDVEFIKIFGKNYIKKEL